MKKKRKDKSKAKKLKIEEEAVKDMPVTPPSNGLRKYLGLTKSRFLKIVIATIAIILLHNFIFYIFGFKEPILTFIVAIIVPLYLIISATYTFVSFLVREGLIARIEKKVKYPKFILLIATFVAAYILFKGREFLFFNKFLFSLGYFGTFLAGMMFAYGFTAAPATAIFLILSKTQNILLAGLIGGLGSLCADLLIFRFIRTSFQDEIDLFANERLVTYIKRRTPNFIEKYFLPVFAGFVIASPLPDEIGVSLLALLREVKTRTFMLISYSLNTLGIIIILLIGHAL